MLWRYVTLIHILVSAQDSLLKFISCGLGSEMTWVAPTAVVVKMALTSNYKRYITVGGKLYTREHVSSMCVVCIQEVTVKAMGDFFYIPVVQVHRTTPSLVVWMAFNLK